MSMILKQKFGVQIHQLFRTAGLSMGIVQTEQLQAISDKLVDLIEETAKERAVELIRKMQEAVGAGFTAIGKDVDAIETRLAKLEPKVSEKEKEASKSYDDVSV